MEITQLKLPHLHRLGMKENVQLPLLHVLLWLRDQSVDKQSISICKSNNKPSLIEMSRLEVLLSVR